MKLLSVLMVVVCLFMSSAHAEINMIDPGARSSYYGNFLMSYDAESQTYWAMIHVVNQIFGVTVRHRYRVYRMSQDWSDISLEFETMHSIYSMVAAPEGLLYEREIYFVYISSDIYYYHTQSRENKRCVSYVLCGAMDNAPLYYRDIGLCSYDSMSKSETVIIKGDVIAQDNEQCIYQTEDGSTFAFLFQSGTSIPVVIPENISRISNGYMLDEENMMLYSPDNSVVSVPFIAGAKSISMKDGFLCALDASSEAVTLHYISLNHPEEVTSVTLPHVYDWNLNVQNGNAFFYTKPGREILALDLSTNSFKTITLTE